MANTTETTSNPHESDARAAKSWRIAAAVIRSARGDLALLSACATMIASATECGEMFCRGLWASLGESNPTSAATRAMVAERIDEHLRLVRAMHVVADGGEVRP